MNEAEEAREAEMNGMNFDGSMTNSWFKEGLNRGLDKKKKEKDNQGKNDPDAENSFLDDEDPDDNGL
jgi:hypothetical protein